MDKEVWRISKILGGEYEVSNFGKVRNIINKRILKSHAGRGGYRHLSFRKYSCQQLSRLIAYEFVDNPYNFTEVNHKDRNKNNNYFNNLEWVSPRENSTHRSLTSDKIYTSKYIGVSFDKFRNKWKSTIYINGKQKYLGRFDNEYDAYLAYQKKLDEVNDNKKYRQYEEAC